MLLRSVPQILPGAALASSTGLPRGALAFPDAGGVQAVDKTGAIINLVASGGSVSILPSANDTYDLGSGTLNWRAAYVDALVGGIISSRVSGSDRTVIAYGADISAVNNLSINAGATGVEPTIGAVSLIDTNVSLSITRQGTGNILLNGGATGGVSVGVNAASKVGLYAATPVVRAAAITAPATQGVGYVQADVQSIVTAVNAIRVALTNIGVTL